MRRGCEFFPRLVETESDLPLPIRDALDHAHPAWQPSEIVVIPPQRQLIRRRSWRRELPFRVHFTPPRTLAFGHQQITLVEGAADDTLDVTCILLTDLVAIRLETILLYSTLELMWIAPGEIKSLMFEFNSVGGRWIERGLRRARTTIGAGSEAEYGPEAQMARDDGALRQFPLKFRNYLWFSLLPEEPLCHAVYQPAIQREKKGFRPALSPNRLIALAGQTLLALEDAQARTRGWGVSRHGIAQHFYPRGRVCAIHLERPEDAADTKPAWMRVTLGDARAQCEVSWPLEEPLALTLQPAAHDWLAAPAGRLITLEAAPEPL